MIAAAAQEPAFAGRPLVEIDRLTVRYHASRRQQVHAVESVSFSIRPGECVGVVGESGCGKSTMMRSLIGLQRPTAGAIRFRGLDVWSMPTPARRLILARQVGAIFQDPTSSLNRRLRVEDILTDPLVIHRIGNRAARAAKAAELIELVGLPGETLARRPTELSGGQRQRVAIARALALEPSLIVADEPTSALDVSIQNQVLNLLLELRRNLGVALLFVSHNIQAVSYLADRVVVMYLGRVVEEGPVQSLRARPRHPYTLALLSATPMITGSNMRIVLEGTVPSARNPPPGCPFHPRCWRGTPECTAAFPPPSRGSDDHVAYCVHPDPYESELSVERGRLP